MSTKASRALAVVDDAAREACENGTWVVDLGHNWGDYLAITATHATRRLRGEWAVDLAVTIHWDGDEPVTRERTIKFTLDQGADAACIAEHVSDSIGVMIQADRAVGNVGDFAAAIDRIYLDRLKKMFLGFARSGR